MVQYIHTPHLLSAIHFKAAWCNNMDPRATSYVLQMLHQNKGRNVISVTESSFEGSGNWTRFTHLNKSSPVLPLILLPIQFNTIFLYKHYYITSAKVCFQFSLFVCQQDYIKTTVPVFMVLGGRGKHGPRPLHVGADPSHEGEGINFFIFHFG